MPYTHVLVERSDRYTTITMNRPERRNALSLDHLRELLDAFRQTGDSDSHGVILAANGPVFSAGHDFSEMHGADLPFMRRLLNTCKDVMETMCTIPQPVVAKVHGLATAAGCQLAASCDLAVASEQAAFAIPGGKGGWFCHTPLVAVARNVGRKRAAEMAFTGDPIDANTASDWGLINKAVPHEQLDAATLDLLDRATRGSPTSKGLGKDGFYAQVDLGVQQAYELATQLMAASSQEADAQEGMAAFLEKRAPNWAEGPAAIR